MSYRTARSLAFFACSGFARTAFSYFPLREAGFNEPSYFGPSSTNRRSSYQFQRLHVRHWGAFDGILRVAKPKISPYRPYLFYGSPSDEFDCPKEDRTPLFVITSPPFSNRLVPRPFPPMQEFGLRVERGRWMENSGTAANKSLLTNVPQIRRICLSREGRLSKPKP